MNSPVDESQGNGRTETAARSAGSDRNATGRTGEEIEHENQVKRPDIPVDGRVVSRIDHKICERQNRQNRGHDAQAPIAEFGEKINEQEWAESRCEVPRWSMAGAENEE